MINENNYIKFEARGFAEKMEKISLAYDKTSPLLLFIEPYGACISLLRHAIERGMSVVIFTANQDLRRINEATLNDALLTIEIETADCTAVLAAANLLQHALPIAAVIPGFEYFVPVASAVATHLSLPSIATENVLGLRNKHEMRKRLKEHGVAVPAFTCINTVDDLELAFANVDFPAILKPIDSAGSVCVSKVHDKAEAMSKFTAFNNESITLWGHTLSPSMLLEEYINGKEFSVEGVVANGSVIHFCITEKILSDEGDFVEIGHIANPVLDKNVSEVIRKYVNEVIAALGANHCPFHAELRLTEIGEPILMEIAARLPGDKIAELVNHVASHSFFDAVLAVYLGLPVADEINLVGAAAIRFFYRPNISRFLHVEGFSQLDETGMVDKTLYYQPEQMIPPFPKALRRLGHVIVKSDQTVDLCYRLHHLDKQVSFIENDV